jgi:hypothetical protein
MMAANDDQVLEALRELLRNVDLQSTTGEQCMMRSAL